MSDQEKDKKELSIEDLPKTELTPEEMESIAGGLSIGPIHPLPIPILGGTTTPRADTTYTNPDDVDAK
jgi:hypothetical protein